MLRILIANQDYDFAIEVKESLSDSYAVDICSDGRKVLECCYQLSPDILVIDLEMPHLDGLSTLRLLKVSGHNTKILVLSGCLFSGYVLQTLTRMGITFMLPKPCTMDAVVSMIYDILESEKNSRYDIDEEANYIMLSLGLRPKSVGYRYLNMALSLLCDDPTLQITKTVYPVIAEQYHVTDTSVERAIRTCIHSAWRRRNPAVWEMFFPLGHDGLLSCPSNSQFIARIALALQKRKIG